MAESRRRNDIDNYNGTNTPGSYQRTSINDIINNFIIAYVGQDKVIGACPRHEVAFHAQRSLQEFSYDILNAEKSIELELDHMNQIFLPPDYVNYVGLYRIDQNGNAREIKPTFSRKPSQAVVQDEDFKPVFDEDGDIVYAEDSEALKRFKDRPYDENLRAIDYYNGYYYNDDFSYYNQKRFGQQTHLANQDYTYMLDNVAGIIYFNSEFTELQGNERFVTLRYISDGLADGDDLSNCYVPKLAEDAIYAKILYELCRVRPSAAQMAQMYKKEASAKMRNAKIRLTNWKSQEVIDLMRMKSKWIKH